MDENSFKIKLKSFFPNDIMVNKVTVYEVRVNSNKINDEKIVLDNT